MRPGMRFGLSEVEKRDVWSRWKAGQTLHEIGRDYDKPHTSIRAVLLPRGGIRPTIRRRSRLALTLAEREDISRGIASGSSIREVASRLLQSHLSGDFDPQMERLRCHRNSVVSRLPYSPWSLSTPGPLGSFCELRCYPCSLRGRWWQRSRSHWFLKKTNSWFSSAREIGNPWTEPSLGLEPPPGEKAACVRSVSCVCSLSATKI